MDKTGEIYASQPIGPCRNDGAAWRLGLRPFAVLVDFRVHTNPRGEKAGLGVVLEAVCQGNARRNRRSGEKLAAHPFERILTAAKSALGMKEAS
jgi:hypothetical protein